MSDGTKRCWLFQVRQSCSEIGNSHLSLEWGISMSLVNALAWMDMNCREYECHCRALYLGSHLGQNWNNLLYNQIGHQNVKCSTVIFSPSGLDGELHHWPQVSKSSSHQALQETHPCPGRLKKKKKEKKKATILLLFESLFQWPLNRGLVMGSALAMGSLANTPHRGLVSALHGAGPLLLLETLRLPCEEARASLLGAERLHVKRAQLFQLRPQGTTIRPETNHVASAQNCSADPQNQEQMTTI